MPAPGAGWRCVCDPGSCDALSFSAWKSSDYRQGDLRRRIELTRRHEVAAAADADYTAESIVAEVRVNAIPMYHEGSRQLQDQFEARKLADRMVERIVHDRFTDEDRAFIESRPLFFLATADAEGRPDCSYKGGLPGFVRVIDPATLAFPSYDGNGMFKSLGNVLV